MKKKRKERKRCIHACDWFRWRKHAESGVVNQKSLRSIERLRLRWAIVNIEKGVWRIHLFLSTLPICYELSLSPFPSLPPSTDSVIAYRTAWTFRFYREITVTRLLECFLRERIDRMIQKEKKKKKRKERKNGQFLHGQQLCSSCSDE